MKVSVKEGSVVIEQVKVLYKSEDCYVLYLNCETKYAEATAQFGDKGKLHLFFSPLNKSGECTEFSIEVPRGNLDDWMVITEETRYSIFVTLFKRDLEGEVIWNRDQH